MVMAWMATSKATPDRGQAATSEAIIVMGQGSVDIKAGLVTRIMMRSGHGPGGTFLQKGVDAARAPEVGVEGPFTLVHIPPPLCSPHISGQDPPIISRPYLRQGKD